MWPGSPSPYKPPRFSLMRTRINRALTVCAVALIGCDLNTTSDHAPGTEPPAPAPATITLSGAVAGSYNGFVVLGSTATGQTEFSLTGPASGASIGGYVRFPGAPAIRP